MCIRRSVKEGLSRSYSFLCSLTRRRRCSAILCPAVPHANLGDQAMVLGAIAEMERQNRRSLLVKTGPHFKMPSRNNSTLNVVDRHGFFISAKSFRERIGLESDFARAHAVFVIGADILDGHYGETRPAQTFEAIRIAIRHRIPVRVVGFSISHRPSKEAIRFFRRYSNQIEFVPRDPVSLRRLQDVGVSNPRLAADVAFLMSPAKSTEVPEEITRFVEANQGCLLGLSLHAAYFQDDKRMLTLTANLIEHMVLTHELAPIVVAHHPDDLRYMQHLRPLISKHVLPKCLFLDELPTAPIAKRLFGSCDHVLTSRMHVAIASLGMSTPVTCFPYLGKFEGLFEHFGLTEGLINNGSHLSPSAIGDYVADRIARTESLRESIESRLSSVIELSRSNFDPPKR